MAKKIDKEETIEEVIVPGAETTDDVTTGQDPVETPEEETETKAPTVSAKPAVTVAKVTTKEVSVHVVEPVDAWIGGTRYILQKGKTAKVPADVAAILANSRKVYRN